MACSIHRRLMPVYWALTSRDINAGHAAIGEVVAGESGMGQIPPRRPRTFLRCLFRKLEEFAEERHLAQSLCEPLLNGLRIGDGIEKWFRG
jgi:hypothetical protein